MYFAGLLGQVSELMELKVSSLGPDKQEVPCRVPLPSCLFSSQSSSQPWAGSVELPTPAPAPESDLLAMVRLPTPQG